jgi:hypothetical protein
VSLESLSAPGGCQFKVRTWENVQLGPLRVAIRSNEKPFTELQYFPARTRLARQESVNSTVNCCNLNIDGPWPLEALQSARDKTYRGGRFAAGYYLTDHFGPPAYLVTTGTDLWIFAPRFDAILWPFVVKLLLTTYSIDRRILHLKAAAVSFGNDVTLLVGRGGTGKTVLLTRLCQSGGAQFLANTHVLVAGETVMPVSSAMRVRNDSLFGPLIAARALPPAFKVGEFLVDPLNDLGWEIGSASRIRNICLLNYQGPAQRVIRSLEKNILFDYVENFSLALNIYGLREDMFDYLGADANRFSSEWSDMKSSLRDLVDRCNGYYISCDVTESRNLDAVRELLAST